MEEQRDAHPELLQSVFSETTVQLDYVRLALHIIYVQMEIRLDLSLPSSDFVCVNNV